MRQRSGWVGLSGKWLMMAVIFCLSLSLKVYADDGGKEQKIHQFMVRQNAKLTLNQMELEAPPEAEKQEITVAEMEPDLAGIKRPRGFRAISKMFRFGPDGLKFSNGKELRFRYTVAAGMERARLYYINRRTQQLELVAGQTFDSKMRQLKVPLRHFSDYVVGVSVAAGWDDIGFNPFSDYINGGIETVSVFSPSPLVRLNAYSIKGRELDLNFTVVSSGGVGSKLKLDLLFWDNRRLYEVLNIPGKGSIGLPQLRNGKNETKVTQFDGLVYNANGTTFGINSQGEAYLNDGTRFTITKYQDQALTRYIQTVKTLSGNAMTYYYHYEVARHDYYLNTEVIIDSIVDTLGRKFVFNYSGGDYDSTVVIEQVLSDSTRKTILTYNYSEGGLVAGVNVKETITDNLNQTYIISYLKDVVNYYGDCWANLLLKQVEYPNGVHSEYVYRSADAQTGFSNFLVTHQKWFKPNQTTPFREVKYDWNYWDYFKKIYVEDGNHRIEYNFEPYYGYILSQKIVSLVSGKLLKEITNTYTNQGFNLLKSSSVRMAKADGTLGEATTYQYEYDEWANLTKVIDPYGNETLMAYANTDSSNSIPTVKSEIVPGEIKTQSYNFPDDELLFLIEIIIKSQTAALIESGATDISWKVRGYTCTVTYQENQVQSISTGYQDPLYTCKSTRVWNRLLSKATLLKDPVHNITQLKQTHYQYDANGNLEQASEAYNGNYLHTYYRYDSYGNILTKIDPNGNTLGFEYSSTYNSAYLTRAYQPETGQTLATYEYDFDTGNKTKAIDPKGNVYRYEYDAGNRLTKEYLDNPDPNLSIVRNLSYDDTNNIVTLQFGNDANGWQQGEIFYHPLFGKPITIQRKLNGAWQTQKSFAYDTNGRLASETDGMGHTTTYTYDALDRKIKTVLPDGATTTALWDSRTVTITDPKGQIKKQTYDLLDRLVQTVEYPDSATPYTTTYVYNSYDDPDTEKVDSHLIQVINPKGAATQYTYDNLGRLLQVDYPQDGTNPMAAESYSYDAAGNLTGKTMDGGTKTLSYEYFGGYRVKNVTEPDGRQIRFTYDPNDNLLSQTVSNGVSYSYTYDARNRVTGLTAIIDGRNFTFNYQYDLYGRTTGITYPNRMNPVTYQYDELDRVQAIPGFVTSCSYDLDNKILEMVYSNTVANTYRYDVNDRPTQISAGGGGILDLNYSYDLAGNITQLNNDYYGYDGLNRLVWYGNGSEAQSATADGTRWTYDGAGNMTGKETLVKGVSQGVTSFGYDLANRLWTMGSTIYQNDAKGARTAKGEGGTSWDYSYDGESRLIKVTKNAATQVENVYDGTGMRVRKDENGKTTYYIYSGASPLLEYTPTDGSYLYRIYGGKQAIAEEKNGVVKFYHKDHLGSTRAVTDAAGTKIAEYKFAPYGEKESASGDDGTEYGFTDKTEDASTGLRYFGARFYDPEMGRFLTIDPAKKDGWNWYWYCKDNPLKYRDPNGESAVSAIQQGGKTLGAIWGGALLEPTPFGEIAATVATVTFVGWVGYEAVKDIVSYISTGKDNTRSRSNPLQGQPGTKSRTYDKLGNPKQDRIYGNDGFPNKDIDYDHDHGQGKPHEHIWSRPEDGSKPTTENRGPGQPVEKVNSQNQSLSDSSESQERQSNSDNENF